MTWRRRVVAAALVWLALHGSRARACCDAPLTFYGSIPFEQFQEGTGFMGAFNPKTGEFAVGLSPGGRTASMAQTSHPGWPRPTWQDGRPVHLGQALGSANGGHHQLARGLIGRTGALGYGDPVRGFTVLQFGSRLLVNPASGVNKIANTVLGGPQPVTLSPGRGLDKAQMTALVDLLIKHVPRGVQAISFIDSQENITATRWLETTKGTPHRRIPLVVLPECFAAGTLVQTQTGARPIETLKPGDAVWSMDPATGTRALKRVVRTFANPPARLVRVTTRGDGRAEELRTTASHRFFVRGRGWVPGAQLERGMVLVTRVAPRFVVSSEVTQDVEPVFNLEVEDFHTYLVGAMGVLVHNDCAPTAAPAGPRYSLNSLRKLGGTRIPFTPSRMALLSGVSHALRAAQHGAIPAAIGFVDGMARGVAFAVATRAVVGGLTAIGFGGAGKVLGRAVPVVGQALLLGDVALSLTNLIVGANAGWGDVWDAYMGRLDQPTYVAGPAPAPDQDAYFD